MSKKFYRIPNLLKIKAMKLRSLKREGKAFYEGIYFMLILVHNNNNRPVTIQN